MSVSFGKLQHMQYLSITQNKITQSHANSLARTCGIRCNACTPTLWAFIQHNALGTTVKRLPRMLYWAKSRMYLCATWGLLWPWGQPDLSARVQASATLECIGSRRDKSNASCDRYLCMQLLQDYSENYSHLPASSQKSQKHICHLAAEQVTNYNLVKHCNPSLLLTGVVTHCLTLGDRFTWSDRSWKPSSQSAFAPGQVWMALSNSLLAASAWPCFSSYDR